MTISVQTLIKSGLPSGYSGSSGYSGFSGFSGISGFSGMIGAQGISSTIFEYFADTTIITGDPGNGDILWNNSIQTSATQINVSHITNDGIDIDIYLALLQKTEVVTLQDKGNSSNYQTWLISNTPVNNTNYWTIPVTLQASGGTGTTNFTNGQELIFALVQGISGHSGYSGISGFSGYSGSGISGFSGYSGISGYSGPGIPSSGNTGQILVKNSSANYDTGWASGVEVVNGQFFQSNISSIGLTLILS